ncbi:methyltransferase TYW3-domain-containing protein [Massariosphaeria phaeospora]|uniref:tRNA(Phe) 7-[(3-amino-3-carboxypropyl)-4-demethylwyosine(37)-N(4)]-methyltransferase n=1 Tax=Massariosphaeria phaeospora TaxID=100035 RepID=A0A7C8M7Q8_9PLEO|nr:methyltransferase TYW3-domain-containing protein [Massariosphaeria phaeospora]
MQSRFKAKKQRILEQLNVPNAEYQDLSPKGSVDEPIRELIDDINMVEGLVTTSSCSGRMSVFLEGQKKSTTIGELEPDNVVSRAGPGGKGGGSWLYISHTQTALPGQVAASYFTSLFSLQRPDGEGDSTRTVQSRHIHLKFEPMILHILTSSLDHSQHVLNAALNAGFRESGAVSLSTKDGDITNPMVAVRSTGYSFDSIIGYHNDHGQNIALVDENHIRMLVEIANERFKINIDRISRFRSLLLEQYRPQAPKLGKTDWEDPDARKRRKREEGLARQRAITAEHTAVSPTTQTKSNEESDLASVLHNDSSKL